MLKRRAYRRCEQRRDADAHLDECRIRRSSIREPPQSMEVDSRMTIDPHSTTAWIYQPAPNAMQSGRRKRMWHLEFDPADPQRPTPLMGWIGGADMDQELTLRFPTRDEAIRFAEAHGIRYRLEPPTHATIKPKSYAANFMPHPDKGYGH